MGTPEGSRAHAGHGECSPGHKQNLRRQSFQRSEKEMGGLVLVCAAWSKKDPAKLMIRHQQRRWEGGGQFPWKTEWLSLKCL